MKKFKISISTFIGCDVDGEFEVSDDANSKEVEEEAMLWVGENADLWWEEIKEDEQLVKGSEDV